MVQMTLFQDKKRKDNLERVRGNIERVLLAFAKHRIDTNNPEFYAEDLLLAVESAFIPCAPDSPGRIMRLLRREGLINYKVVSRKDSLYRLVSLRPYI